MQEDYSEVGTVSVNEIERRQKKLFDYLMSEGYQEKIKLRLRINDAALRQSDARAKLWNLCAREDNPVAGCIFFINNFGYTFDPRPEATLHHFPFILYQYQEDAVKWLIEHIDQGKDGLIEKSRDMGVSWLVFVWVLIWYWIFRDGVNMLIGSYKEALVDNRTKDSLFGMIDYAIDSLPRWILPRGFNKEKHRTQMKLTNPVSGNLIVGDTMNPDFGRGTRKTAILFDELGSWEYAKDAWDGAADSTSCRIANSTPKGYNFYAMLKDSGIDVLTLHWRNHPLKDEVWYAAEKARRKDEAAIAQELDISYNKSMEGRVYPEWDDSNVTRGTYEYDPNLPLYVGWDFGGTDDTAIIWAQPSQGKLRIIDSFRKTGKLIDFYVPFITGFVSSDGYAYDKNELKMIEEHRGWKKGIHFGDPAGRFRNQVVNITVLDVLRNNGIIVNFADSWKEFSRRKTAGRARIMQGIEVNKNPRTTYFDLCISQAAFPKIKNTGVTEIRSNKPKHDYTSHYRSAFEYLCLGLEDTYKRNERTYDRQPRKERRNRGRAVSY